MGDILSPGNTPTYKAYFLLGNGNSLTAKSTQFRTKPKITIHVNLFDNDNVNLIYNLITFPPASFPGWGICLIAQHLASHELVKDCIWQRTNWWRYKFRHKLTLIASIERWVKSYFSALCPNQSPCHVKSKYTELPLIIFLLSCASLRYKGNRRLLIVYLAWLLQFWKIFF